MPRPERAGWDLEALVARVQTAPRQGRRCVVAIAGAPTSGKSTLAASLTEALRMAGEAVENVPMDGFHLDNRVLDRMGLRARKGAPETFDAEGFRVLVKRLKAEDTVYFPIFDRTQDHAIAGAGVVGPTCDQVVIEGNYLLFDEPRWAALAPLWDLSIWIDTPEAVLRARCIRRWLDHGHGEDAAIARAEGNDLRNARRILGARLPADVTLQDPADGGTSRRR